MRKINIWYLEFTQGQTVPVVGSYAFAKLRLKAMEELFPYLGKGRIKST